MKVLFLGSDSFAIPTLAALHGSKHEVLAVVTQPDKPAGRGQKTTPCPVAMVAKEHGFHLLQPEKISDPKIVEALRRLGADVIVVAAYGQFIPSELVKSAPHEAVNIHPSLLPKYRGAAPIQWALLNGDTITGVTTMKVAPEMDAGDIYLQCSTPIDEVETAADLYKRLGEIGAELLLETLKQIKGGTLKGTPQNKEKIVLAPKLKKEEGLLEWNNPAEKLFNRVRALNPWPGTFTFLQGKRLKVLEAAPVEMNSQLAPGAVIENKKGIIVACGKGALCLLELQLEGKNGMSAADFLKGHPLKIGEILK